MQHSIEYGPAYALARLSLDAGDSVMTEAGAMVSMRPGLEVQTSASGAGGAGSVAGAVVGADARGAVSVGVGTSVTLRVGLHAAPPSFENS